MNNEFMKRAIELSVESVKSNGGPFGACVVGPDNKILGEGMNRVAVDMSPILHAEVVAINEACKKLNSFDLSKASIYSSCQPCVMCLGAIYWSRISKIYYANTKDDAAKIDFDDSFFDSEMKKSINERKIPMIQIKELQSEAIKAFELWDNKKDKIKY